MPIYTPRGYRLGNGTWLDDAGPSRAGRRYTACWSGEDDARRGIVVSGSHGKDSALQVASAKLASGGRSHGGLLIVLAPLLLLAALGIVWFWPSGAPMGESAQRLDVSEDLETGVVRSATSQTCPGAPPDRLPDGTIPLTAQCVTAVMELVSGDDAGARVTVPVPPQVYRAGLAEGARVSLARYPASDLGIVEPDGASDPAADQGGAGEVAPSGDVYAWADFSRGRPLTILAIAFAVLIVAVGRLRGVAAVAGLGLGYVTIIYFMLPALRQGENAVGVALSGSVAIMTVILYLAHGFTAKTTAALLGTIFGLAVTAALAAWTGSAAHLNGLTGEDTYLLSALTGGGDLSGIILCGIIVAGLGVLNDVTITQASAVWEVHAHAPALGLRRLFTSGMRVGRDHLASTIYTIAFAYAGAALPTLLLIDLYNRPLGQILTSGEIAEEVARTMVGSIGLILAIPLTTAIAAAAVARAGARPVSAGSGHGSSTGGTPEPVTAP